MTSERNVLGGDLLTCSHDQDRGRRIAIGCQGRSGPDALTVCALMTQQFLVHQRALGNDLSRPDHPSRFPGLTPGESWCVSAARWIEAYEDGAAPPIQLDRTSADTLALISKDVLLAHGVDVPQDPRDLLH